MLFLLFGFYSLLAQVLLLREIAQVFTAHELSLAAALAAWLFWTAAGVRLYARLPAAAAGNLKAAAALFAVTVPANVLLARLAPGLLPALFQPGLFFMFAASAALCLPAGICNGLAIGAALPAAPSRFYAAEAFGAAAAGLFTILYFRSFPGLSVMDALAPAGILLCAAWAAQKPYSRMRAAAGLGAAALLLCARFAGEHAWRLKPPAPAPSEVIQTEGSRLLLAGRGSPSFYEDGRLLHGAEDPSPEEFAHIPLLSRKGPVRALLSGSGAFLILPEVLKHRPASVDIAEPDRFKAAALARWTGAEKNAFTLIPRDSRQLKDKNGFYDIIFQTASSPENGALNRYFTLEYFRSAAAMLKPGGLLVFQLPFAGNYVPKETAYAAACVLASARAVFPRTELIPGSRLTILASEKAVSLDPAALAAAYARRGIKNREVVPSALPFILDPYRRAWAENELNRVKKPPLNTDLNPLAYFRFWRVWVSMVASPSALLGLAGLGLGAFLAASKLMKLLKFSQEDRSGEAFLMGFWSLSFETALLLAFQARTGRLAPELGLLFAVFMAGSAAGARAGGSAAAGIAGTELAAAALSLLCAAAAPALLSGGPALWLMMCGAGVVTGFFFARAAGSLAGKVYAADLLGGAAGGLATAAFSAPLAGIKGALVCSGLAALAALCAGACPGLLRAFYSLKASTVKE